MFSGQSIMRSIPGDGGFSIHHHAQIENAVRPTFLEGKAAGK
jgi:hypothetical protein